jgi:hypothetical protein
MMMRDHDYLGFLRDLAASRQKVLPYPTAADRPNALHPDTSANGPRSPMGRPPASVWHSDDHRDMTLHCPKGALRLDRSGKTRISASDHETAAHLASRGLHECQAGPGCARDTATEKAIRDVLARGNVQKSAQALLRQIDPTGATQAAMDCDNALLRWFHGRAEKSATRPFERRIEPSHDPQRATYATSYAAWRQQYFGDAA